MARQVDLTVSLLRELLRNLLAWRSLYTSDGVDTITCPDGRSVSLWDLEYLYEASQVILPIRQRQAIRLCLVMNYSEQDAADVMHIDQTNPVAMYATSGLEKIIHMSRFNILPTREYIFASFRRKSNRTTRRKIHTGNTVTFTTTTVLGLSPYLGIEVKSGSDLITETFEHQVFDFHEEESPYLAVL